MNPNETRSCHPSSTQVETLVEYMEKNPGMAKGFLRTQSARERSRRQWEELAVRLNSLGGTIKNSKQWTKYWSDKKSAIKKKVAARSAARRRTGGGVEDEVELSELEERVVALCGGESFSTGDAHLGIQPFPTWQDKKSIMKKRALTNPEQATDFPALLPQTQTNMTVSETPVPGPSSTQESGVNIEDIFQAGGTSIKLELDKLDTSDSDDPLNFEEEYLVSDPASPEPEPEPEIEQPRNTARDRSRRRFRRVLRRPLTHSRLDVINHITVNEVKKALIQKNEIKKQFYAQYMVEIRKQTQALVSIAKRLASNR